MWNYFPLLLWVITSVDAKDAQPVLLSDAGQPFSSKMICKFLWSFFYQAMCKFVGSLFVGSSFTLQPCNQLTCLCPSTLWNDMLFLKTELLKIEIEALAAKMFVTKYYTAVSEAEVICCDRVVVMIKSTSWLILRDHIVSIFIWPFEIFYNNLSDFFHCCQ